MTLISILATLQTEDRLVWLVVLVACAAALAGLALAAVTIVLLVRRRRSARRAGEPTLVAASSTDVPGISPRNRLVVRAGESVGLVIPLTGALTRIGREKPFSDAVIVDEYVSNPHFSIEVDADQFFIVDEVSTNGTRVNGLVLRPHQRVPIEAGAIIEVGQTRLELVRGSMPEGATNPYLTHVLDDVAD